MADDDLKKIAELIKISLKPLRDELALVNTKVRHEIAPIGVRLEVMDSRQEMTNDKLDKIQETLDSHTVALIKIESVLKGYADMYKINKSDIDKIKTHLGMPLMPDTP